ncbi:MAG TPA: nucleoside monophosphate kinase [Spirochaetota bacterium]|mgnify:CR=1 FL=1|nr:nucleoside monophosphate kinase [Spirochaetota bacterium]HOM37773.1 nucleoside monophosphate kinase [Spirochaetota bacterium]HPQ49350.1 nucleoside monophosphate kinase [Spirochaetota bacterium]
MKKILLMGPQGAGKGTVASLLKEKLNIPHISMGDIFRETAKSNTPLGEKLREIMKSGELVPLEITAQMLKERLSREDCQNGYLLDGYPRNIEQAEVLDKIESVDKVVVLTVPREVAIERLTTRIQCKKCGAVFNIKTMPPKKNGICDLCGGELYRREDDTEEAINKRLEIYEKETKPLIERYKSKVLVIDSSDKSPEKVLDIIIKSLN